MSETRCGFVAIIGAPNAGKSTLINALVGEKVSIVTRKAQTTRSTVRGVLKIDTWPAFMVALAKVSLTLSTRRVWTFSGV